MAYNLIDEKWIPIQRKSGRVERIAPYEVSDFSDAPVRIASPRPDFDGAMLEFLIGLLQTAAAPESERRWEEAYESRPKPSWLKERFDSVRDAFNLDADGPRFMQDLEVHLHPQCIDNPVGALLIDRVGESDLAESPNLFAKPGGFEALSYPAAAAALMALQTYAPAGGRGNLTSLRGGGPLTTIIVGPDLWCTLWLNVLPRPEFEARVPGGRERRDLASIFPWMAPTRTSEKDNGVATLPSDVSALQHYWGLPRRNRLVISPETRGTCSIYGDEDVPVVTRYESRPNGTSYEGDFRHPLSPYSVIKPGQPLNPRKASSEGVPYRDWPLLIAGSDTRSPALVVSHFSESNRRELLDQPRLAAFGYAMDNMKPLQWCQATTPLLTVTPRQAAAFSQAVRQLVEVSEDIRKTLAAQVKAAWSTRPGDLPGDAYARVNPAFWSRSEAAFFRAVESVRGALEAADEAALRVAKETWLSELHRAAKELFGVLAQPAVDIANPDLRRAVAAQQALEAFTRPSQPRLRKALGLPVEGGAQKPKKSRKKREAAA